jgi:hypothetical protein
MNNFIKITGLLFWVITAGTTVFAQERQWVEGFDKVDFHYNANRSGAVRDFRGTATGYMV